MAQARPSLGVGKLVLLFWRFLLFVRRISVVTFSVILVVAFVFAAQFFVLAQGNYGENQGEICVSGGTTPGTPVTDPPVYLSSSLRQTTTKCTDKNNDDKCESDWCPSPPCVLTPTGSPKQTSTTTLTTEMKDSNNNWVWLSTNTQIVTSGYYNVCN